jgi:hypothetical protein
MDAQSINWGGMLMTNSTQTFDHPDGGCEIVRVLDRDVAEQFDKRDPLAYEASIRWLVPLECLDFVRVRMIRSAQSRRGRLRLGTYDAMVVGYAILQEDAPKHRATNGYCRRVFYLSTEDFETNLNAFPVEAIDPKAVLPSVAGGPPPYEHYENGYPPYMRRSEVIERKQNLDLQTADMGVGGVPITATAP